MLKDQKELLAALNEHGAEYVVVDGHAAIVYGDARLTKDLNVLMRADEANSIAVFAALSEFGVPMEGLLARDFCDSPTSIIQFGVPPGRIDILQEIEGVSFDEAWADRVDKHIDENVIAHYISPENPIRNKELVGRLETSRTWIDSAR